MIEKIVPRNEPPPGYYRDYESAAHNPGAPNYFEIALHASQADIRKVLKDHPSVTCVALGSATERNIEELRSFIGKNHSTSPTDQFIFLDISQHSMSRHLSHKNEHAYNNVNVIQADMNTAPLKDGSADVIVIDYTINFNLTLGQYAETLESVSRLLSQDGICILTLSINSKENKDVLLADPQRTSSRTNTTTIRKDVLFSLLREKGFSFKILTQIGELDFHDPIIRLVLKKETNAQAVKSALPLLFQKVLGALQSKVS